MARNPGKRTVIVIRSPEVDLFDDPVEGAETTHEISGCAIVPRSTFEEGKGWITIDGYMVAAPYDADIEFDDQVQTPDGLVWEVDGTPARYEKKSAQPKACIFYLKRVGN